MSESDRQATPPLSAEVMGAVLRASRRSAALVHEEMKNGLSGLATMASTAPWVGLLGTVVGIADSFHGCDGERSTCMGIVAESLSASWVYTALGLLIGLPSLWCYRYLAGRLEAFDHEMENASVDLVKQLARLPIRH